jgi:hypothetical protein
VTARSTWTGQTIVFQYGCPPSAKLSDDALNQLKLALGLRRGLVALARQHDEQRQALWEAHPQVGDLTEQVNLMGEEIGTIAEQARKERMLDKSTIPRKETAAKLKEAKAKRSVLKVQLRATKRAAMDVVKPALEALDKRQRLLETKLRGEFVGQGLFWSTANVVLDDHRQAQMAVVRLRKAGRPAERRMPRWNAPATLSTQVMRGSGMPQRSPQLLASGEGPWRNVVQLTPWLPPGQWPKGRGPHRKGQLALRIAGKDSPPLILPVIIHRPIPEEADITDVQITRRMVADQQQLYVNITVRLPKPPPKETGETVAVRFGWKSLGKKWVRVATVATPHGPLPLPKHEQPRKLVRTVDTCNEVMASAEWARVLDRVSRIRGHRDKNLDEIKTAVCKVLEDDPVLMLRVTEALQREKLEVARWRSQGRMVRLWQVWPKDHQFWDTLNQWRKRDRHLWQFEAHERQQIIAHRRYLYRNIAAWICEHAKEVVLSGFNIAELAVAPAAGEAEDSHQDRAARANRQWAAPGDLRQAIKNAAARRGITIIEATTETGTDDDE